MFNLLRAMSCQCQAVMASCNFNLIADLVSRCNSVFPHGCTLAIHMRNILYTNYDCYREPLKVKFCLADSSRVVEDFSIQYVDGFTKGLVCQAIVGIIDFMVTRRNGGPIKKPIPALVNIMTQHFPFQEWHF